MKTHPIVDHVPESELLAITPEGAARWLTAHGWTEQQSGNLARYFTSTRHHVAEVFVTESARSSASWIAGLVRDVLFKCQCEGQPQSPRTIIAEMQADSRIVAELARMSARKKEGGA